jgi:hypothetical protein
MFGKRKSKKTVVVTTKKEEAPPMDDGRADTLFKQVMDALDQSISEKKAARETAAKVAKMASQVQACFPSMAHSKA